MPQPLRRVRGRTAITLTSAAAGIFAAAVLLVAGPTGASRGYTVTARAHATYTSTAEASIIAPPPLR